MNCTNPVLPTVYTDALSYGEALDKVVEVVNECIDIVEDNDKEVIKLEGQVNNVKKALITTNKNVGENTDSINNLTPRVATLETRVNETVESINDLTQKVLDNSVAVEGLENEVGNKVDKEEGKGLSANDYTNADKAIVSNLQKTYQLIDTLTIDEAVPTIQVRDLNLRAVRVFCNLPEGNTTVTYVRFTLANGKNISLWCSSNRQIVVDFYLVDNLYRFDLFNLNTAVTSSSMTKSGSLSQDQLKELITSGNSPITAITFVGGAGKSLEVGTKYEIYGMEA